MNPAPVAASRKRGRVSGDNTASKKQKPPALKVTTIKEESTAAAPLSATDAAASAGLTAAPGTAAVMSPTAHSPIVGQARPPQAAAFGQQPLATLYPQNFQPAAAIMYGAAPMPMVNHVAFHNPAVHFDYHQDYTFTNGLVDDGGENSDTTPSSGQTTAPFVMQPQVQSPVHSHHLGAPYVYSTHPYMPGYELGMGAPQVPMLFAGQQPQGHGMRAPGPYYDTVATAQMAGAQHAGAHPYGLLHRVGLPHPAMSSPLTPTTALVSPSPKMSATQLVGPHVTGPPAYSGTVVPQGARLPTAVAVLSPSKPTNTNANNNQPHTPVRGGRAPQSHVTLTPRLPSATLGSGQPQNHPASRPSPSHAPTPLAQSAASHDTPQPINTPQLPSTLTDSRTAPTPFASTPSSDLSSAPPESPKPNGQAHAAAALGTTTAPVASLHGDNSSVAKPAPPHSAHHSGCIPVAVYTNTLNAFNALRSNSEAWRAAVARLVPGNHPPSEDLVVSLAKRIRELEQCAQSVNGAINNEELRHRELAQTNSVVFQLEQQLHERDNEINRLNALLRSVWTNNSQTQTHEIIARDREIDTLRAELTEAQTKVASLVSVSGVNLSEVQPLFSPTHLSPALERSNSHSVPPTPIYTPAQAFGTEALPVSQNTLLSSSEATEVQSMFSESFSPGFSTMSLDNNPLPLQPPMSAPATASKFAPRICHTPHASISNTEIGEASPWKSWLQLDTSTPSRVSQELGSLPY